MFLPGRHVDNVFTQKKLKETYASFVKEENSMHSFAQFVKTGHWMSILSHFDHHDAINKQPKAPRTTNSPDVRWIYRTYLVTDQLKEQVDTFLHESTAMEAISSSSSSKKSWEENKSVRSFHGAYKFNPETAAFSLHEMSSIMCCILFPLYLRSEEYRHWKAELVKKSKKSKADSAFSTSTSVQSHEVPHSEISGDHDDVPGSEDVEHMKHLMLSTAAFLDESDLAAHFTVSHFFQEAQTAVANTSFGICIYAGGADKADHPPIYANKAFEKMTGYSSKELHKHTQIKNLFGPDTEKQPSEHLAKALVEASTAKVLITLYRRGGGKFLAAVALKPSFDNKGQLIYWIAVYYDLSRKGAHLNDLKRVSDLLALLPNLLCYDAAS